LAIFKKVVIPILKKPSFPHAFSGNDGFAMTALLGFLENSQSLGISMTSFVHSLSCHPFFFALSNKMCL
jgi:hypothetical protein